jgi:hypothetical protein
VDYFLGHPVPVPWFIADVTTLLLTLVLLVYAVRRSRHPVTVLLEAFGFVFLYAGVFENFAVVQGWYVYGRSLFMFGDVPLSIPMLELDVFLAGLLLMEKMSMPDWSKPILLGFLGMLQDFSLDPLAVRQVFTVAGGSTGRWTWILGPGMANIYRIPVYNFPGWMLIMLYGGVWVLLGRWWFRRSGYKPAVGYAYPLLAFLMAFLTMVSPLSQVLLWLAPFGAKGGTAEWIMLAFHLGMPALLLTFLWRGRMTAPIHLREEWPVFAIPLAFHAADIYWTLAGGFFEILWLVLLASAAHLTLLTAVYLRSRALPAARAVPALQV